MADASNIKDLIRQAMQKQAAAVNTERSRENEADVKAGIPASVDSQTAADAVGRMEKDPAVTIGTKAEASTDKDVTNVPKDKNDDQAFKSAAELRKLAAGFIEQLTKAAEATALDVKLPETVSSDAKGKDEVPPAVVAPSDGAAAQETTSAVQTAATKVEAGNETKKEAGVLAAQLYKLANTLLVTDEEELRKYAGVEPGTDEPLKEEDVNGLDESDSDELATALQASAEDAANEGTQDADNTADYLQSYQDMPGMAEGQGAPAVEGADQLDQVLQMLEEAGVTPEEIMAAVQEQSAAPAAPVAPAPEMAPMEAPVKEASAGWEKLNKGQRRSVVMDVLKSLKG